MEYVTNTIVDSKHNTWTLLKHVAVSINKTAAKTDQVVYGNQVHIEVREKTFTDKHPTLSGIGEGIGAFLMAVLLLVIFIGFIVGKVRCRDFIGF